VLAWVTQLARWYRSSSHRRVLSAAVIVGVFTFAARLAGAAKEILVAHHFGTSDEVDAFGLALTLPAFAISLVGGSLHLAFMPVYVDVRQREGHAAAQRLLSTATVLCVGLLAAAATLVAAAMPVLLPLFASRFTPAKLELTAHLSYLLLPCIVVAGTTTVWTAALYAHDDYARPSSAAVAVPLVSLLSLLALGRAWGIRALAVGLLAGYCVEAALVGFALVREGMSVLPRWRGLSEPVRRVLLQCAPMMAGTRVMGANPVIDSMMAARLQPGSVAALGYGNKLVAFAMGIGSLSLGAAVFPLFSRLASNGDWVRMSRTIRLYALALLALTIPATLAVIGLSEPIARLLYERGAFSRADTLLVARIQALYLVQIPFHITGNVFVRFLSATAGNSLLMWFSFVSCVVNVVGNVVLSRWLGAAGIALSTSLVYVVSFTLLGIATWRRLHALSRPSEQREKLGIVA